MRKPAGKTPDAVAGCLQITEMPLTDSAAAANDQFAEESLSKTGWDGSIRLQCQFLSS